MKAPNLVSLLAGLVVILPSVSLALTQQFPSEMYWWSALITGIIGAAVKAIQVYITANQPLPPVVDGEQRPVESHKMKAWLLG